jgi:hemerythrin
MPFIVWTNQLSVDVKILDNDHKRLAILINDLHNALMAGCDSKVLDGIFNELVANTRIHFAHEERLLAEAGYSGAAEHKQLHEQKIKQVLDMQARFRSARGSAAYLEVLDQLKDWLFTHTESADKDFVAHLKASGINSILAGWNEPK